MDNSRVLSLTGARPNEKVLGGLVQWYQKIDECFIGFDDGSMKVYTRSELNGLYDSGRFIGDTHNSNSKEVQALGFTFGRDKRPDGLLCGVHGDAGLCFPKSDSASITYTVYLKYEQCSAREVLV